MYDFICGHGTIDENELTALLNSMAESDHIAYRQYAKGIFCEPYNGKIDDIVHLLEIRLFNLTGEIRAVRSAIGKPFIWRKIDDEKFKGNLKDESFDERTVTEKQYLDIDSVRSSGKEYRFIGGGSYTLPIENAERIEVRSYGVYDVNGIFNPVDFRIVRILAKGEQ